MRQRKVGLLQADVVIGDHVEIERARAPASLLGSHAAEFLLDFLQHEQERVRIETGLDLDAGVDEGILVLVAPGWVA